MTNATTATAPKIFARKAIGDRMYADTTVSANRALQAIASNPNSKVRVWKGSLPHAVPSPIKGYAFPKKALALLNAHLLGDELKTHGLWIWGLHGTGKTSLVEQFAALTKAEVYNLNGTGTTEFRELVGQYVLQSQGDSQPTMQFVEGPLVTAMRRGAILLINEVDIINPAELAGLYDVLEGKPIQLPTGEMVKPEESFRLICTANTGGFGDRSGHFGGTGVMSKPFMDRFNVVQLGYIDPAAERQLLEDRFEVTKQALAGKPMSLIMVELAKKVREQFAGPDGDGTGDLSSTISTRGLCRWAELVDQFAGQHGALTTCLEFTVLNACPPEDREVIQGLYEAISGLAQP